MNNGSGDGGGCFGIKVWTDTAYTVADGYGNSKIWRQMRSGRKK